LWKGLAGAYRAQREADPAYFETLTAAAVTPKEQAQRLKTLALMLKGKRAAKAGQAEGLMGVPTGEAAQQHEERANHAATEALMSLLGHPHVVDVGGNGDQVRVMSTATQPHAWALVSACARHDPSAVPWPGAIVGLLLAYLDVEVRE
jgi:hypothetical protein